LGGVLISESAEVVERDIAPESENRPDAFGPASQHRQISISVAKLLRQTPISKLGLKNNLLRIHS
jgi:hypothetical protein